VSLGFRAAVEARDIDAMAEALSPDVTFHSPMAHTPFEGRETVRKLFEPCSRPSRTSTTRTS